MGRRHRGRSSGASKGHIGLGRSDNLSNVRTGDDWFERLYGDGYRGLVLTAHVLLEDAAAAEKITRDVFAVAYRRRARLAREESPLVWVRAQVVRLARRRLRWRSPRCGRAVSLGSDAAVRLHRLACLAPESIVSIVDISAAEVESALADAGPVSWASVRQPVVSRVLARSQQQVVRRRMLVGATVAAVVVGVAVPWLHVEEPAPTTVAAPERSEEPGAGFVSDVTFADDRHGFALRRNCSPGSCHLDVMSTDDRRHWTAHPVREPEWHDKGIGDLVVLGPDEVVIDWQAPRSLKVVRRMYSADKGRTWTRVAAVPSRAVREIPAGAMLEHFCLTRPPECRGATVSMVLPGSGESALLTTAPRLRYVRPGLVPIDGNRWWMVGLHPQKKLWMAALSEDDGRTWTVSALMAQSRAAEMTDWSVVGNGDHLYASLTGPLDEDLSGGVGVVAIFHSADGGRTWERTGGRVPAPSLGSPVAASDGTLLVDGDPDGTLLSRDHGRTFAKVEQRFDGMVRWTRAGYVAEPEPAHPIRLSTDGVHWRDLNLEA